MVEWQIEALDVAPEKEGKLNVVTTAHWRATLVVGEHTAIVYGTVPIEYEPGAFTAYGNLTEKKVLGWVKVALGDRVAEIETALANEIAAKISPPVVTQTPPWGV